MSQRGHRTNKSEAVSACPSLTATAEHIWYLATEDSPGVAQTGEMWHWSFLLFQEPELPTQLQIRFVVNSINEQINSEQIISCWLNNKSYYFFALKMTFTTLGCTICYQDERRPEIKRHTMCILHRWPRSSPKRAHSLGCIWLTIYYIGKLSLVL